MLGALALGVPYIGVETNRNLIEPFHRLMLDYNPLNAPVSMIWRKAEDTDFSSMQYDVVMTSPPYYTLEKYEHMPVYTSREDFYNTFLIPVITKAWMYLKPDGHMILNMPVELYEAVRTHLPPLLEVLEYHKAGRHAAMKNDSKKAQSFEHIYVWRKSTC
jgi:DNA modification methylase